MQQIANRWMAKFREDYPDSTDPVDIRALERYVNSAMKEMTDTGFTVYADGSNIPVQGVGMSYAENNRVNVEFIPYD